MNEDIQSMRGKNEKKIKRKNGRNSVENQRFPAVSIRYDSDWARTSDLYPVKVGDSNPISQWSVKRWYVNDKSFDNGRIFINALILLIPIIDYNTFTPQELSWYVNEKRRLF
ncbi:hypothetical protein [Bacillus paralicheniformis]|uniref:hypothetical protein n=1 Tax=Bacillus paralicheniformis TaxID=1648923 RepID=UPI00128DC57E|nr:hypothetical protein [Bacillus paralicheniformis]MPQ26759.1 hypothetical protein [Bacillus paralicheniformis]